MMRSNKQITRTHGKAAADVPIDLEAGLLGIRKRTMAVRITIPNRSRGSGRPDNAMGEHLACLEEGRRDLRRRRHSRHRYEWVLIQFIAGALGTFPIRRQICICQNRRPLWIRDEQEGQVIAVVEEAESGADDGLPVRRIGESNAGLKALVTHIHLVGQAGLEVISQAVVESQFWRRPSIGPVRRNRNSHG